jgi:hypothetical protein
VRQLNVTTCPALLAPLVAKAHLLLSHVLTTYLYACFCASAGLLDDAYSLSLVWQLNVTAFLALAKALGGRTLPELPPWSIGLGWLQVSICWSL